MAVTKEDVLEFISGLSVLELSELVKEFEEKFGVSTVFSCCCYCWCIVTYT
ncbi:MAG: hypothetical protein Q9M40_06125, partial [Sulfurimonas sp.]|nr:hypothetical protein [Sulfurimonas sp.]